MSAYLLIDLNVTELEGFMRYAERIPEMIRQHGGRYLVQGVEPTVVEASGDQFERSVVIEFPTRDAAERFLDERSRSDLHAIWAETTRSRILLVDGC